MTTAVTNVIGDSHSMGVTAMHLYADPTCVPGVMAVRSGKTESAEGHVTLHGHYARIPGQGR